MKVVVLPCQEKHIVGRDRRSARMAAEALQVDGHVLCQGREYMCGESRHSMRGYTDLSPYHLRQCADKLRSGISVSFHRLFVDHLTNSEPEGGFQTLHEYKMQSTDEKIWGLQPRADLD